MAKKSTIYEDAAELIRTIGKQYGFAEDRINTFLAPDRIVEVSLPVEVDGKETVFTGYRIQHNNSRGPYKGGIRFHQNVTREEVMALSLWMSLKTAIVDVPYGGGKGGVTVDPKTLSEHQLESLSREFSRKLYDVIGPQTDIPAPDVNTNPKIINWMVDEYVKIARSHDSEVKESLLYAAFTGKPTEKYGLQGRAEATGFGGAAVLRALAKKMDELPQDLTIAVQGFGNVGFFFSKFATDFGFRVVAVSDSKGGVTDRRATLENSLDIDKVLACKLEKGVVSGCYCVGGVCDINEGRLVNNEELLKLPVDVLVPSALEDVITEKNMKDIKAQVIIEMANGPVSPVARDYLTKKGVKIVPDILANAGGVAGSYLEWRQNVEGETYEKEYVLEELEKMLGRAFDAVWEESEKKNVDLVTASYTLALERLVK